VKWPCLDCGGRPLCHPPPRSTADAACAFLATGARSNFVKSFNGRIVLSDVSSVLDFCRETCVSAIDRKALRTANLYAWRQQNRRYVNCDGNGLAVPLSPTTLFVARAFPVPGARSMALPRGNFRPVFLRGCPPLMEM